MLSLAVFMSSLDLFIVNLAFPYIGREFSGPSLSSLSWVLNGYTIVLAAVLVPAGRWADRVGRRRLFAAGLIAFSIGSLLCGLAPGVLALIGARVIQAIGAGLMVPASLSLLLAAVPGRPRARAIGTWSALGALGAALGPVIGGGLVQLSWRWVFWINLPVGLAAVLLAARVVPESKDEHLRGRPGPDRRRAAGRGGRAAGLRPGQGAGLGLGVDPLRRPLLAAVACGAAMVFRSAAASLPGDRARAAALADLQRDVRRLHPVLRGLRRLRPEFSRVPHRRVALLRGAGRAGDRPRAADGAAVRAARGAAAGGAHRRAGPGGRARLPVNAASQLLWLSQMQAHPAYLTHLLPAQLLGGAGVGLTIPSLLSAGSAALPPDRFGTGSGVLNMARQVGTVLGVAGLVAILAHVAAADPLADLPARHPPHHRVLRGCRGRRRRPAHAPPGSGSGGRLTGAPSRGQLVSDGGHRGTIQPALGWRGAYPQANRRLPGSRPRPGEALSWPQRPAVPPAPRATAPPRVRPPPAALPPPFW